MTVATACPQCGADLGGLATYCHVCEEYVADMGTTSAAEPRPRVAGTVDDRLEDTIQLATKRDLESLGFVVYDLSQGRKTRQTPGLADLFVVGHGVTVWGEMKTRTGVQSEAQASFERNVVANGGTYLIWRHESEAVEWARGVIG